MLAGNFRHSFLDPQNALSLAGDWAVRFREFTLAFYPLEDDEDGVSLEQIDQLLIHSKTPLTWSC
jgi:hypothetical protein